MTETIRKKVLEGLQLKLVGNERLKAGKYQPARDTYVEGLKCVLSAVETLKLFLEAQSTDPPEDIPLIRRDIDDLRIQLVSNLSLVELKLELWQDALEHASMVLAVDPGNTKALFRRAVARIRLEEHLEAAKRDLERLLHDSPESEEIKKELETCKRVLKKSNESPSEFNRNIRSKFSPTTKNRRDSSSILSSWMDSWSSMMAQCGGARNIFAKHS